VISHNRFGDQAAGTYTVSWVGPAYQRQASRYARASMAMTGPIALEESETAAHDVLYPNSVIILTSTILN
jgi:hypothetical protein